jgi:hypothetical protein
VEQQELAYYVRLPCQIASIVLMIQLVSFALMVMIHLMIVLAVLLDTMIFLALA